MRLINLKSIKGVRYVKNLLRVTWIHF